jgi:hypothetical protein
MLLGRGVEATSSNQRNKVCTLIRTVFYLATSLNQVWRLIQMPNLEFSWNRNEILINLIILEA